jgi:hypothetical protein
VNLANIRLAKYYNWNGTAYIPNPYRLISDANRQSANNLTFCQAYETLAILDFFNNILFRQLVAYRSYLDEPIPIETVSFINNYDFPIILTIKRGLGVEINNVLAAHSSWSVRLFATEYSVYVRNLHMQLLDLTYIRGNNSSLVIIDLGLTQEFTIPILEWALIYVLISVAIAGVFVNLYYRFKDRKERTRSTKRAEHEKDMEVIKKGLEGFLSNKSDEGAA